MRLNWKTTKQVTGRLLIRTTYTLSVADSLSGNRAQHKQLTHNCNPTIKCYWSVRVWSRAKAKENWPELQQVSRNFAMHFNVFLLLISRFKKHFYFHSYFKIIFNMFNSFLYINVKEWVVCMIHERSQSKWYNAINNSSI